MERLTLRRQTGGRQDAHRGGSGRAVGALGCFLAVAAASRVEGARQGSAFDRLLELVTRLRPLGAWPKRRAPGLRPPDAAARAADVRSRRVCWSRRSSDVSDPYVGRISAGPRCSPAPCAPTRAVHVSGHGLADPRPRGPTTSTSGSAPLTTPFGKQQRPVSHVIAGDLACVAKLSRAETGDTLSAKDDPLLMAPWEMPDPLLPLAIQAHSKPDEDKLSQGLSRLVAEDPTMRLPEQNQDTHQVVLWCLGEAHADVALGAAAQPLRGPGRRRSHRVSLRETFGDAAGRGRGT